MSATDRQVQQVRVRLLHSSTIATLRQRTQLEEHALAEIVDYCVKKHGLHADLEGAVDLLYWNWRRDPRMTLVEYLRSTP